MSEDKKQSHNDINKDLELEIGVLINRLVHHTQKYINELREAEIIKSPNDIACVGYNAAINYVKHSILCIAEAMEDVDEKKRFIDDARSHLNDSLDSISKELNIPSTH